MQLLVKINALTSLFSILIVGNQFTLGNTYNNLTCYQCVRNTNIECGNESLLACPSVSDRCVTKNAEKGLIIKRECGLGPCGFDDDMVNIGLGINGSDRSDNEYSCLFCCNDSGCNKNDTSFQQNSVKLIYVSCLVATSICLQLEIILFYIAIRILFQMKSIKRSRLVL